MERIREAKEKQRKAWEDKPSGKEIFLSNKKAIEDLTLEADEFGDEFADDDAEEVKQDDDESDEEAFKYDRALYDADELIDEDVDFDD